MKEEQNGLGALVVGKLYITQRTLSVSDGTYDRIRTYPAGTLVVVVDQRANSGYGADFVRVRLLMPDGEVGERADTISTLHGVYREMQ
jgi:hypothetical protein